MVGVKGNHFGTGRFKDACHDDEEYLFREMGRKMLR